MTQPVNDAPDGIPIPDESPKSKVTERSLVQVSQAREFARLYSNKAASIVLDRVDKRLAPIIKQQVDDGTLIRERFETVSQSLDGFKIMVDAYVGVIEHLESRIAKLELDAEARTLGFKARAFVSRFRRETPITTGPSRVDGPPSFTPMEIVHHSEHDPREDTGE